MAKHILDHERRRTASFISPYALVIRKTAPEGSSPATKALMRRVRGPWNPALRAQAFVRIDRKETA
jgi:hypothetical protein